MFWHSFSVPSVSKRRQCQQIENSVWIESCGTSDRSGKRRAGYLYIESYDLFVFRFTIISFNTVLCSQQKKNVNVMPVQSMCCVVSCSVCRASPPSRSALVSVGERFESIGSVNKSVESMVTRLRQNDKLEHFLFKILRSLLHYSLPTVLQNTLRIYYF